MKTRIAALCLLLGVAGTVSAEDAPAPAPASTSQPAKATKTDAKAPAAKAPVARGNDQLTLDSTLVTGNRELPKVMYIVPWKKAELSNLPGQPFNTLIDETLAPVDREVFRREVAYYDVVADKDHAQVTPPADAK